MDKSNFPSLPVAGKNNNGARNKLKLPRKAGVSLAAAKESAADNSPERTINLIDDEPEPVRFTLPFFVNDGAPPLPPLDRPMRQIKNPYYVIKGEPPAVALKRMLAHHDRWKQLYQAEINRLESHALGEDGEESEQRDSPRSSPKVEDKENDPYDFVPESPIHIPSKMYTGTRKRETNKVSDVTLQPNNRNLQPSSRTLQRKASRDSDCEEIEPLLKPEEPKGSERISTRTRGKRNRKQMSNNEKNQTETNTNVEFDFDKKWDPRSSAWQGSQTPSSSSLNNQTPNRRSLPGIPVVEEEKVQCPICQRNFAQSKVENHAATCEGYSGSGSPMDVEEEES
uniref:UBZ4-type domain-containing protein n=1 Tax=Cuerna arida TaxID=1464854 RepID=A0A1B6GS20_9HEMI